jgi:nucleoside-diphosphate-sugar epimerase
MKIRFFLLALLIATVVPCLAASGEKKKILSFGGNGMIGTATLLRLIDTQEYDITLVSRGTWPFDTEQVIKPHVTAVVCNREDSLESCSELINIIETTDEFYAVLDFSGFEPTWVQDAVQVLQNKVRVYVYVSTDSVYEVSEGTDDDIQLNRRGELTTKLVEAQAVRPSNVDTKQRLNEADPYGDEKLSGEEVLQEEKNFPFVILRFSDVIGPRDGTDRWMLYHLWIKYSQVLDIPITVPEEVSDILTSATYVEDAASAIISAIKSEKSWNDAYNVACEETFNVVSCIHSMADIFGLKDIQVNAVPAEESFAVFPSVRRGPMDITRAKQELKFVPTPLQDVLNQTVEWYETVFAANQLIREHMLEEFIVDVLDEVDDGHAIERLLHAVGEELGVDYGYDPDAEYDDGDL